MEGYLAHFLRTAPEWGPYAIVGLGIVGTCLQTIFRIIPTMWHDVKKIEERHSYGVDVFAQQERTVFIPTRQQRFVERSLNNLGDVMSSSAGSVTPKNSK